MDFLGVTSHLPSGVAETDLDCNSTILLTGKTVLQGLDSMVPATVIVDRTPDHAWLHRREPWKDMDDMNTLRGIDEFQRLLESGK